MFKYAGLYISNAFTINARASRSEFWFTMLTLFICTFVFAFIMGLLGQMELANLITAIVSLALFVPGITHAIRRCHDVGISGWWYILIAITLIGPFILALWPSQEGSNQWGDTLRP